MADQDEAAIVEQAAGSGTRRGLRVGAALIVVLLGGGALYGWLSRKSIADDYLAGELARLGLPATYQIAAIGPDEQVLRNLVIGDPRRPDLTIEEVHVATRLRFGFPGIGRITLIRPRLFGAVVRGKPSFGALDKLLFTGSKAPFRLPDYDVDVQDGRARIATDYGTVGVKIDGKGALRDGFVGEVAAIAPNFSAQGCDASSLSLYGRVAIKGERPTFAGPVRLGSASCAAQGLSVGQSGIQAKVTLSQALDGGEGELRALAQNLITPQAKAAKLRGKVKFAYHQGVLNAKVDATGERVAIDAARAGRIGVSAQVRTTNGFSRFQIEGDASGAGIATGRGFDRALLAAQRGGQGTLAEPLISRIRQSLARHARDATLDGSFLVRRGAEGLSVVVPRIGLHGRDGTSLLAASRVQVLARPEGLPHISGNFTTGGADLPRIAGRMERAKDGSLMLHVQMARYQAGDASLAIPDLSIVQARNGAIGFAGGVIASGVLPGGRADNLMLPVDGRWHDDTLALWRSCVDVRFDRLTLASLSIDRRQLTVCPAKGRPLVAISGGKAAVAGGIAALDLAGRLGQTPIRIASGPVGFAYPGVITARSVNVSLGPPATPSRFRIANLTARAGREIGGTFDGSDVALNAVPLDLHEVRGRWRYAGGALTLADASFRLEDREAVDRFQPVIAREATLSLRDNIIDAKALLREPASDQPILLTTIRHDLSRGRGAADLAVQDITFDQKLQPDTLTRLALGVIANARGTVRGQGRIDWDPAGVTSQGTFKTDKLDFAAAFGPVQGVSGAIQFSDLLGLVTAPRQILKVASINPGIEVNDGTIVYALQPNYVLSVEGGTWPFVGGTLKLQPTRMIIGSDAIQNYTMEVTGADAALFVQRLELANLNATGTFDGTLPLVIDKNGGRIEGGMLRSRPPGGNVSYVGELTYKDLSAMANFAFDTLRSLDYRQMTVGMDGALQGEIVTRVSFSGVTQGEGAMKNFLTRRIGKLPIQFNVNLRAPFFQLITSFKSLYDPAYVRDPRTLGLIDATGKTLPRASNATQSADRAKPSIQPTVSEPMP